MQVYKYTRWLGIQFRKLRCIGYFFSLLFSFYPTKCVILKILLIKSNSFKIGENEKHKIYKCPIEKLFRNLSRYVIFENGKTN